MEGARQRPFAMLITDDVLERLIAAMKAYRVDEQDDKIVKYLEKHRAKCS